MQRDLLESGRSERTLVEVSHLLLPHLATDLVVLVGQPYPLTFLEAQVLRLLAGAPLSPSPLLVDLGLEGTLHQLQLCLLFLHLFRLSLFGLLEGDTVGVDGVDVLHVRFLFGGSLSRGKVSPWGRYLVTRTVVIGHLSLSLSMGFVGRVLAGTSVLGDGSKGLVGDPGSRSPVVGVETLPLLFGLLVLEVHIVLWVPIQAILLPLSSRGALPVPRGGHSRLHDTLVDNTSPLQGSL